MYLKKIIANGFKSFADKITLNLAKENITGIVGPNGSGKSNVIDAVRWVMGEQNAKMLRGEKATDIIFIGSEKRKPLGMAEVSLVFDNQENSSFCPAEYRHDEEIVLTRRLYIDGQREYFINRKPCRLKDIVSFFASTGLGGRSYSMIQQGQVDRILQAKPEELREILEEAAGISRFKQQRLETSRKLEKTQYNLSRVEDILVEVDRQMDALKEQVAQAEKWQEMTNSLRDQEIDLLAHNFVHFQKKEEQIKLGIEDESLKEVACIGEISSFEKRHQELKQTLDAADPELHALNEEITVLREKIASSEALLGSNNQLLEHGDEQLKALSAEIDEDKQNLENHEKQFSEAKERLEKSQQESLDFESILENLNEQREYCDEEYSVFKNKVEDLAEEKHNLDRFIENNKIRRENIEKEYSQASRNMAERTTKVMQLEDEHSHGQILVDGMQVKLKKTRQGLEGELEVKSAVEMDLDSISAKNKTVQQKIDDVKSTYLESKARLHSLEEMEKNSGDSISKIKNLQKNDGGSEDLLVLLTDAIEFLPSMHDLSGPAKEAFEQWAERLLVRNDQHLSQVESYLVKNKIGRVPACFMDEPSDKQADIKSWSETWQLKPIQKHLKIESENEREIQNILSRVFYIDGVSEDREGMLKACPLGAVLIFSSGLTIISGQDCVIGQTGLQGSLVRKDLIKNIKIKVETNAQRLQDAENKREKLELEELSLNEKLKHIEKTIFNKNQDVLETISELKTAEHKALHMSELIVAERDSYAKLESNCERLGGELEELQKNDSTLREEKAQAELALEDIKSETEELVDRKQELQRQCEQKRVELASVQTMAETLAEHYDRDKSNMEMLQGRMQKRLDERDTLAQKIANSKTEYENIIKDIETFVYQREELEEKLSIKKQDNAGIIEELRSVENRLREARQIQNKAQKMLSEKEVELERVRLGVEGVKQQALEKYHISLDKHEFEFREDFEAAAQARRVGSLRTRLEALGPVNMMAIDEYRELSDRHDFMQTQKEEVISSVNLLELAIEEIEETSKDKFISTFTTLNVEFQALFPILFPRGEGILQLNRPDDPLESGVEILVRLPGKSRQNMRLFSGGEKALTAIALIFALLKSKPTPYCFLDEVDAPLDETNVGRYNNVLEALSDRFQFIVITHRRRTMEVLDTLYGVTMQEPGVSKVVGVDLAKTLPAQLRKAFSEEKKPARQGASAAPSPSTTL